MKQWLRRIRGAIGIGLTWAAVWFGAGILLARVPGFYSDLPFALLFAPLGFVTGVIFSGTLVAVERRRRLDRGSLSRFAGWGAVIERGLSSWLADASQKGAALEKSTRPVGCGWPERCLTHPILRASRSITDRSARLSAHHVERTGSGASIVAT